MKNKMNKKYLFDIAMTIVLILLMDFAITGLALHEWLGIAVFIMFAAHKLFNYKWIKNITLRLFDKKIKARVKLMYVLDLLLLLLVLTITLSGLLISENIFAFSLHDRFFWVQLHSFASYAALITISVHVGFHWKVMLGAIKKMFHITKPNTIRTAFVRLLALFLVVAGIKSSFDNNIAEKLDPSDLKADSAEDNTPLINSKNETASQTKTTITSVSAQTSVPTLSDYLGNLHCTLCSKHCSLLAPRCSKGKAVAAEAEVTYNSLYAQKSVTTTAENSDNENTTNTSNVKNESTFNVIPADVTNLFADYLPIMGLYIAGTYYLIEFTEKKKKD